MAAGLLGERFLGVREPAWHRMGTVIPEPVPASVAIQQARVDFGVETQDLVLPDGTLSGYVAIVREALAEDDGQVRVLGVAKSYEVVHVTDIATQLDGLPWPVTSVGALGHGEEVFIAFDLGAREILGEDYKLYLGIITPYAPGRSWRAMLTPVRIVCQNTARLAAEVATASFAVTHHHGAGQRVDSAMLAAKAEGMTQRWTKILERMGELKLETPAAIQLLQQVFPDVPAEPRTYVEPTVWMKRRATRQEQVERFRETVLNLYDKVSDEFPTIGGTGYALYQATVEFADYFTDRQVEGKKLAELSTVGWRADVKIRMGEAVLAVN